MKIKDNKEPSIKFPEDITPDTVIAPSLNNPVDKVADLLPRALFSVKENFKEAVFLFGILGYIFIAAFGHMEKVQNYVGYFFVFLVSVLLYKMWDKIHLRDVLYSAMILGLVIYILWIKLGTSLINWF